MELFVHVVIFLCSAGVIWFCAGQLIDSVERIARRFHQNGFAVAFFFLGLLTSISEMSVAFNAVINDVPGVSAGNLIGASFVILLLIVPLLAIAGRGIGLKHTLSDQNLKFALVTIALPALFVVDGIITRREGIFGLCAYLALLFVIHAHNGEQVLEEPKNGKRMKKFSFFEDGVKIFVGGVFIFLAGHFLVEQAVYFARVLSVPGSFIGLILLSVGTNVPEITIAIRSIFKKRKDIAFGDYVGSAATNTLIFGVLVLVNGDFKIEVNGFLVTTILTVIGFFLFYLFAKSKRILTRFEGTALFLLYVVFILFQVYRIYSIQ